MFKKLYYNGLLQWIYFGRPQLHKAMLLLLGFSIAMLVARVVYTGSLRFVFLGWNLLLASLPLFLSQYLGSAKKLLWLPAVLWLLFMPNAFYLITDLFHLRMAAGMPLWFDLALLLSFALNGLWMGLASVQQMESLVIRKYRLQNEAYFIYPVMLLNAFGIYIGRYLRYNSWDVLSQPFSLLADLGELFVHPFQHRFDWSMMLCFSVLMSLIYDSVKALGKPVQRT